MDPRTWIGQCPSGPGLFLGRVDLKVIVIRRRREAESGHEIVAAELQDAKLPDPAQIIAVVITILVGRRNAVEQRRLTGLVQEIFRCVVAVEDGAEEDETALRADADHAWRN